MGMEPDHNLSRTMWEASERFHALCYVAPQVRTEGTAIGLKGFWMNYFATRAAPMGPVSASVVESTFFYYSPSRVRRAIPDAWRFSSPSEILQARYRAMDQSLLSVYQDSSVWPEIEHAARIVKQATLKCEPMGRALFAGWADLPWPGEPHLDLWHGCTLLREYRSGNHLISLCTEGLDGCQSVVSHAATGGAPWEWVEHEAGWSTEDRHAAVEQLGRKGWLATDGSITAKGIGGRQRLESLTNRLDWPIWDGLGNELCNELFSIMSKLCALLPPDDQLDWELYYDANEPQHLD